MNIIGTSNKNGSQEWQIICVMYHYRKWWHNMGDPNIDKPTLYLEILISAHLAVKYWGFTIGIQTFTHIWCVYIRSNTHDMLKGDVYSQPRKTPHTYPMLLCMLVGKPKVRGNVAIVGPKSTACNYSQQVNLTKTCSSPWFGVEHQHSYWGENDKTAIPYHAISPFG